MFLYPHFLWLLLLPLLLAPYQLRKTADVTGPHKLLTTGLRLLALSLVILALARPFRQTPEASRCVVAVVDCSPSMDASAMGRAAAELKALAEQAGRGNVRLVVFGATAREVALDDAVLEAGGLEKLRFSEPGSAVAEALGLAAALCPDDANGDVHLFSDGRETRGDMVGSAARLGRRGLVLKVHEQGAVLATQVLLRRVHAPCAAAVGEAVTMAADVECRGAGEANMTVTNDKGETVVRRTVRLRKGTQDVPFQVRPEESGLQRYHVSLEGGNRTVTAGLNVSRTVVGVFETAPEAPATRALEDTLGPNAEVKPLALVDLAGDSWDGFDVLVLADTPATELPVETQQDLRTWVENGGGLLVTGGRNTFGPGGYARSELADMLPLRFPQKKEVRDPSTSLAVIIDTSGSMGTAGVNLAKEVARLALKRLKPHDKAGIVEFHGAKRWAAPMQPAANNIAIQRALNRLSAGGGTVMMPAIEEAYYGLLNVRTRTKHVLVLTDGGVEQGAFETLLRRMADDGIHVSTVLVGPRAGSTFLAQLASWGRGQFFTAPSRFKLPEVIVKQPSSSLLNPFVEGEVGLEPVLASQLTRDLELERAPALRGYVKTVPKDTAELLLRSEIGDPILARWHYGLGRVAILTTQLGGDWAEGFLNWPAAPNMMANLVRQLRGVSPRQPLALTLAHGSAGLDLDIRSLSRDPSLAVAPLRVEVKDANGALAATRNVMPVRARAWQTLVEGLSPGDYLVEVKDAAGAKVLASGGVVVPPPDEFDRAAPDRGKLAAAAHAARDFAAGVDDPDAPVRTRELWPLCATFGLLSYILMILVRRLPVASAARGIARTTATGLALLVTLGALGLTPAAMGGEKVERPPLTPAEKERVDGFIKSQPTEGRQDLESYCRELTKHHGDLQPLCDYLKSREEDEKARQLLVVAAIADGDLDLAGKTLAALVGRPDPDLWALSAMARVQEMQGQSTQALETLERALAKTRDPGMRFAMLVRKAQLRYDAKEKDAARKTLRSILEEPDFNRPEGRNYLARIAGLHGDYELVEELFTPAGEGRQLMRDRLYFGQILMHQEKPAKAREQFDAALKLSRLQRDRRYVLDRIADAAREADELPKLMDEWMAAEEILPEQLEILVGVLSGELDRAQDVLALLQREDLPARTQKLIQSPAFQERMIMVALETGKSELARQKYRDLIARYPRDLHFHNGYVRLLLMEGERDEAQAFLRKTIDATETVGGLMGLATSARGMALDKVAMEAATKAGAMGELAHVQTVLFEAELHRQHGDADKALEALRALEKEIGDDAELMVPLGAAYEQYGYRVDAIRMIQKAYDLTGNEKLLQRLIAMKEAEQQYEQAFALWRKLWETATERMAIIQAQDRLLDIGSKNGSLADIAIELEERLDQGRLSDKELAMLLEIYTSVNDPVSAADILLELSSRPGSDKIDIYRRMVQVYMECELFGRCNAVLRKMIKLDPDNRDDYLQSLALIALERKNDGDAVAVLQELAARSADGMLRDSFSASVLNMIGRHKDAARAYRRALADNPDEVEAWLLWANAMSAPEPRSGQRRGSTRSTSSSSRPGLKQAIGMFSVLLEEAADDDMFTIAVDGLLNVRAGSQVLPFALRRVNERIALKPRKMFLYRLAADLHDELRRPDQVRSVLEQGLIVAEDGRSIILRELIAMAKMANRQDDVIRYGRSLLNTAEHLPPNECLELGTMLLGKGHFSEADSAFQRVIADGDVMGVTRDIVLRYENVGLFGKASKLLRELLIGSPFDVELLLRLGIIEEKKANFAAAGKAYKQALDLMIGRLPRLAQKVQADGSRTVRHYTRNLDETRQYFELAAQGLILSARTQGSRQQLLDTVQSRVQAELKGLEASKAFGKTYAENPRLLHLTGLMRRLGFAFHRPEYFDPMDDGLLKRYPEDTGLLSNLTSQRAGWGMTWNAHQFQTRNSEDNADTLTISPYLDDPGKLKEVIEKQKMTSSSAGAVVPLLAMCGHDDLIDSVLAKTGLKSTSQTVNTPLVIAGLAANRPAIIREILFSTLAAARRYPRSNTAMELRNAIVIAWPNLSEEDRVSVTNQYGMLVDRVSSSWKRQVRSFHHYLMCQVGRSQGIDLKDVRDYFKGYINARYPESHAWGTVIRWLLDKPEAERPEAVRQLLTPLNAREKNQSLMQLALLLDDKDISDELEKVFEQSFKPTTSSMVSVKSLPLILSGYRENRLTNRVREAIASFRGSSPGLGSAGGGAEVDVDKITAHFKSQIATLKPRVAANIRGIYSYSATLRQAADILPPEKLDLVLKDYIDSNDPVDMLFACLLLRYAGRETEAMTVLHRISTLSPEDPQAQTVRAAMPPILVRFGWYAHAPRFLGDGAGNPAANIQLHVQLHDPLALLGGSAGDALNAGIMRMYATMLMKDPAQFLQAARIYWADTRNPSVLTNSRTRYRVRRWPSRLARKPGGLLGMDSDSSGVILDDLSAIEDSQDELSFWLSAMPTTDTYRQPFVCHALAANVHKQGLSRRLRSDLEAAARQALLNSVDIKTIVAIAAKTPEHLPKSLADQMALIILNNRQSHSDGTAALSKASRALGLDSIAQSLGRWSVAQDVQSKGTSRWLPDYLQSLPEEARRDTVRALLPYMGVNAVRLDAGGDEAALFTALLDLGMETEAADMLERYLQRLRLSEGLLASTYPYSMYARMQSPETVEPAPGTVQDALAVALARLNRPEDYKRVLSRQALLEQSSPSRRYVSMPVVVRTSGHVHYQSRVLVNTPVLKDHTHALPEPGQVKDINRYIDVHLAVNAWLRGLGKLSRESHVAQVCMLGAWCAKRGLDDRAGGLVALAEELSDGMLTGRLWVADLHRLRGQEQRAAAIERELLRHDVLPLSRVPAALKATAETEGRARADAIAYRVASYSNHPEVLPLALRHAREHGMKDDARDLAERLHKVSTLFLPPVR